jgi:uncharacterized membrane protein
MTFAILAAAAIAATVSGHTGPASDIRLAANTVRIVFKTCNKTTNPVFVAGTFMPDPGSGDQWQNEGWKLVAPNACRDIFTTSNRTFYARAEVKGDPDTYWGKDSKHCVVYPGPYKFMNGSNGGDCVQGEPAMMSQFTAGVGVPAFTWTLNP